MDGCFFWYQLTRVDPPPFGQRAVKRSCEGVAQSIQFHMFVCPRSRIKTAGAIDTKLGRPVDNDRTSACTKLTSKGQHQTLCSPSALALYHWPVWELHVDSTANVPVPSAY